jgi:cold shock CspA family protein
LRHIRLSPVSEGHEPGEADLKREAVMISDKLAPAEPGEAEVPGPARQRPQDVRYVARGAIKWFNRASDYGYIVCDQGGPDRYVRGENIIGALSMLRTGSRVEFESRESGMGPEAVHVRQLSLVRQRSTGTYEPSRRHGPFDPRFRRQQAALSGQAGMGDLGLGKPARDKPRVPPAAEDANSGREECAAADADAGLTRPVVGPLNRQVTERAPCPLF